MDDERTTAIRERAYQLWIAEGELEGCAEANWLQAEQEYDAGRLPASGDSSGADAPPDLPEPKF